MDTSGHLSQTWGYDTIDSTHKVTRMAGSMEQLSAGQEVSKTLIHRGRKRYQKENTLQLLSYFFFLNQLNELNYFSQFLQDLQTSDHPNSFCLHLMLLNTWFFDANTGTMPCTLYENSAVAFKTALISPCLVEIPYLT